MRTVLTILGGFALLMGLIFMGQGLGIIRWPADSFMIDMSAWVWRGALVAGVGAMLIWLGQRR